MQIQIQRQIQYKWKYKYNISAFLICKKLAGTMSQNSVVVEISWTRSYQTQQTKSMISNFHIWLVTFIRKFLDIYFLAETNLRHAMSPEAKKIADYRFDLIGCRLQSIQCLVFIPFQFVLFFVSVNFYFIFLYV